MFESESPDEYLEVCAGDVRKLKPFTPNTVVLLSSSKGDQGMAKVDAQGLLDRQ